MPTGEIHLRHARAALAQVHVVETDVALAVLVLRQQREAGVLRLPHELLDRLAHGKRLCITSPRGSYIDRSVTLTQTHNGDLVGEILALLLRVASDHNRQIVTVRRPLHGDLHVTRGSFTHLLHVGEGDTLHTTVGLDVQNHHGGRLPVVFRDDVRETATHGRPGVLGDGGEAEAGFVDHLHLGHLEAEGKGGDRILHANAVATVGS